MKDEIQEANQSLI
jgi:Utp21 specific WD40 associated putative domain